MTTEQINKLLSHGKFPENPGRPELVETHISWVFICDRFVYKIKKPILYTFLDFSTLEKRKYFCEREIELNRRCTENIYLDVQPVCEKAGHLRIGYVEGTIIDYAVRMRKIDREKQMDRLLKNNKVSESDMEKLANKIAAFHRNATIIYEKNILDIHEKFSDILSVHDFLEKQLGVETAVLIHNAVGISRDFIESIKHHLATRLKEGFFRDCHGDLHSRNIFLLPDPQPFDCIEFNDDYRRIDVLNEVAFLCMDLESFGRRDLAEVFLKFYDRSFPTISSQADQKLFTYYKCYRSNIRAKINSLRARDAINETEKKLVLTEAHKYLHLMDIYVRELNV